MDVKSLENYYETTILPSYDGVDEFGDIEWIDHGKVDLDAWAHHFKTKDGDNYVLVWEDFPGNTYLDDGMTHEIVPAGGEQSVYIKPDNPNSTKENISGYFTLFREKTTYYIK